MTACIDCDTPIRSAEFLDAFDERHFAASWRKPKTAEGKVRNRLKAR